MAIITISRLTGSGGREIAAATAEALRFQMIDRQSIEALIQEQFPLDADRLARIKRDQKVFSDLARSAIAEMASKADLAVLGCGAQLLFRNVSAALHLQVVASLPYRIARIMRLANIGRQEAEKLIQVEDRRKFDFIYDLYGANWRDPIYYDLVLNIDNFSTDRAVQLISQAALAKGIQAKSVELPAQLRAEILTTKLEVAEMANLEPVEERLPAFAHPSEREFARVMDFYRIRWQYEPRTFPINWDSQGTVTEAFTPDFYLPDLDLYIEITTMKQSLVTKKNRKIRRLRKLYPDVNIKILYERDYRTLIWKYGLNEAGEETGKEETTPKT